MLFLFAVIWVTSFIDKTLSRCGNLETNLWNIKYTKLWHCTRHVKWFSSPLHKLNGIQYQYSETMLPISIHLLHNEIFSNEFNMRLDNLNNGLGQYWWDDRLYQSLGFNFICGCSKHCISEKLSFFVRHGWIVWMLILHYKFSHNGECATGIY